MGAADLWNVLYTILIFNEGAYSTMANGANSFYLRIVIVIGKIFIVSLLLFFNQLLGFYLNRLCLVRKTKRNNISTSEYGGSFLN